MIGGKAETEFREGMGSQTGVWEPGLSAGPRITRVALKWGASLVPKLQFRKHRLVSKFHLLIGLEGRAPASPGLA